MKKRNISLVFVLILSMITGIFFDIQIVSAKKSSYITSKKYVGTYSYNGESESEQGGWFDLIINKIKSNGTMEFQVQRGSKNGIHLYYTPVITASIKGNKAKFRWEDSWGCNGTGKIVFVKGGKKIKLTLTEETSNFSSLACRNQVFKK